MNDYLVKKNKNILIAIDSCLGGYSNCISAKINDGRLPKSDFRLEKVAIITCD